MIVRRYLVRNIYASTAMVLAAFVALFVLLDVLHELTDLGKGSYSSRHLVRYVAMLIPGHIYDVLPVAALIGGIYAFALHAQHSEITVMRASGLSTLRLASIAVAPALLLVPLTYLVGEVIAPPLEQRAQRLKLTTTQQAVSKNLKSGFWLKSATSFVNVRNVFGNSLLADVRVYEFDAQRRMTNMFFAERAEFSQAAAWQLKNITRTHFNRDNTVRVEKIGTMPWVSELHPAMMDVLMVRPEKMPALGLYTYVEHLKANRLSSQRYEVAFWNKLVYPVSVIVMLLLAAPFAYLIAREGGISLRIFAGIMLGIVFFLMNGLASHLTVLNTWPPYASAAAPAAAFALLAFTMLWWVNRR